LSDEGKCVFHGDWFYLILMIPFGKLFSYWPKLTIIISIALKPSNSRTPQRLSLSQGLENKHQTPVFLVNQAVEGKLFSPSSWFTLLM
jgi:hypothetical protein